MLGPVMLRHRVEADLSHRSETSPFQILRLSSPLMHGDHVRNCQYLLKNNRHRVDFMPHGSVDGQFGPKSAAATLHAQWWLGYPTPHGVFGPALMAYLVKDTMLQFARMTAGMVTRHHARIYAAQHPLRTRMLDAARGQVGYSPGQCAKYSTVMGRGCEPWCADFVSWCAREAGYKGFDYSYVPNIVWDAVHGRNHLTVVETPLPGDLCCYDWEADGVADHVGLFDHWGTGGYIWSTDGNTGATSEGNGGQVETRERATSLVQAYVRIVA